MKFCTAAVLLLSSIVPSATAFLPQQQQQQQQQQRWNVKNNVYRKEKTTATSATSRLFQQRKGSLIEGNQRNPSDQEKQLMDEMITKLADAKPYELPNAVRRAFRVVSSPQFFLRIAERTDAAIEEDEKEKLAALASNLVATLEVVVETTEETLDERAKEVEEVLKAAADLETGEFLVPLLPEQVQRMRNVVENLEPYSLDEGFLSTVDAFMNKSHQDGMDGMVEILQKCLQQYSGVSILRARKNQQQQQKDKESSSSSASSSTTTTTTAASELFEKLLKIDTEIWDEEIQNGVSSISDMSTQKLINEIQKTMVRFCLVLFTTTTTTTTTTKA
jgi:hypothetical protein